MSSISSLVRSVVNFMSGIFSGEGLKIKFCMGILHPEV